MNKPNMIPTGLNFCPVCGCNIKAISLSLAFTAPGFVDSTPAPPPPPPPRPALVKQPAPVYLSKSERLAAIAAEGQAAGKSISQIARENGIGDSTLWYHINKVNDAKGIKREARRATGAGRKATITTEQKDEIRRRYSTGETPTRIANAMSLKPTTVGSILYKKRKLNGVEVGS